MVADSNWTEVGYSYPSCESIYIRKGIVGPGGGITLTPPLVLTEPNNTRITTALGTIALQGFATPFTASTRLTMQSLTPGNEASVMRWFNSAGTQRYSLGNDASGNGNPNWWLFDLTAGIYPLYFQSGNAGDTVGSIRWRNGRIAYDTATEQMTRRVANVVRETFDPTQYLLNSGGSLQLNAVTGLALVGGGGLNLQSLDNGTLQAANTQNIIAGVDVNVTSGAAMTLTGGTGLQLLASAGNIVVSGPALVSMTTPGDISVTGNTSVTIASGAGSVDINASAALTLDSVTGVVVGGAAHPVGFYGSVGVAKQVGVPVTAAGIHAALVALNLIAP